MDIENNNETKVVDYFQRKLAEATREECLKAYDLGIKRGIVKGMARHTWTKDGITYVGNGTYTWKDSIRMAKKDGIICEDEE